MFFKLAAHSLLSQYGICGGHLKKNTALSCFEHSLGFEKSSDIQWCMSRGRSLSSRQQKWCLASTAWCFALALTELYLAFVPCLSWYYGFNSVLYLLPCLNWRHWSLKVVLQCLHLQHASNYPIYSCFTPSKLEYVYKAAFLDASQTVFYIVYPNAISVSVSFRAGCMKATYNQNQFKFRFKWYSNQISLHETLISN